jgi:predicted nucleotidyltransferase
MSDDAVILQGIVGSTAYGLATESSDIDRLGVFTADPKQIFGLNGHTLVDRSKVTTNPDVTLHEVWKFAKLCAGANPTVMELLWLDEYEESSFYGQQLIQLREKFLSTRVRSTYGGYATQQMHRLMDRKDGSFKSKLRKRKEKHGRHLVRLILQGTELLETGKLRVKLTPAEVELCRTISVLPDHEMKEWFEDARGKMDAVKTDLPETPDYAAIDTLLFDLRMSGLGLGFGRTLIVR